MHAEHAGKRCGVGVRRFGQPFGCVVDDRPQAVGVGFQFADEGENPALAGKVGEDCRRPQIAPCLYAGAFSAIAEDQRMAVFEQSLRAVQADTLAGTGDEDRGG
ncbi:hypothetical protein D3C84_527440 [compost metagenome]